MAALARPSLDVTGTLDRREWLELHRASLRRGAFWPVIATAAGLTVAGVGVALACGVPAGRALAAGAAVLAMLAVFGAGSVWLGPRLRFRRVPERDRTARWRIGADGLHADPGGEPVELAWNDVERVRVTRRLVTFELTGRRGVLALPRRVATDLGETLILGWADARAAGPGSP